MRCILGGVPLTTTTKGGQRERDERPSEMEIFLFVFLFEVGRIILCNAIGAVLVSYRLLG